MLPAYNGHLQHDMSIVSDKTKNPACLVHLLQLITTDST